jgi:NAD(P)-dependent dehydrogenase (short-subunit alcohol dehydrogenase family)
MIKNTEFDMTDKVALVSGGSSGLGAHFAEQMALRGAKVAICARRTDRLNALIGKIEKAGGTATAFEMDVTEEQSVKAAFDAAEKAFGKVTVVANNAGVVDSKMAVEVDVKSWDYVLDTNLKGAWFVAREAGQRMIAAGTGGSIVNTASILGLRVSIGQVSYAVSKAAVVQMTKALSLEWARKQIRVNALCPGYFRTEMNQAYFETEHGQNYIKTTPAKRTGKLEELTAPFLLLASDAGSFVSGVALAVDGSHANLGI